MTKAYGVNNLGLVVGESEAGGVFHAFVWEAGRMTDLGVPECTAYGINDRGQIAEACSREGGPNASFLYRGGTATELTDVPRARARAIDNSGQVVGEFRTSSSSSRAFSWSADGVVDLSTLGGNSAQAYAVNELGQVVAPPRRVPAPQSTRFSTPARTHRLRHAGRDKQRGSRRRQRRRNCGRLPDWR